MIPIRAYTHEVVTLWYRAPEILLGQDTYAPAVDMWSIGTIFCEMLSRKALWMGDSEIDELYKIFKDLGTPDESVWSGVSRLKNFNADFPKWRRRTIAHRVPRLAEDADGLDLISRMLMYQPSQRITAREALAHRWFQDPCLDAIKAAFPA